jgi:nitroimidazol reductase NimA-like FMN-containing flavoprotein (pyridoxamine 5'-phosphate oxidase superfamily)
MDAAVRARILDVLNAHYMMALATIRPDGYPQATIVNYVHDGLTLYFASDAASQKAGNIKLNNKVSVVIADQTKDLYKLSALSLSGLATRLSEKDAARIALNLFRRLPQSKRYVPEDARQLAVFSITPVAIALVDYASGFGKSFLVEL